MSCTASGSLVKEDYVKKLVKYEPSPILTDSEGIGGVWEVGKFSDSAPKHLRRRRLYTAIFHATLQPSPSDPLTFHGADIIAWFQLLGMCAPMGNASWKNCTDSLEQCGNYQYIESYANYSKCMEGTEVSSAYGPYLLIFSSTPSSNVGTTPVSAYAKPCPVESSAPDISGKPKIPVPLKLRAWGCTDSTNKLVYNRYVTIDSSTNTYTIAGGGLGYHDGNTVVYWMVYMLPSSTTKGSGDVFQYIYQVATQYQ